MIPLTPLCKQLIEWAYAVFFIEAPKRRIEQLQKRLNRLILQIDIAAGRVRRTPEGGIIGQVGYTPKRRYFDKALQIYGTVTGRMTMTGRMSGAGFSVPVQNVPIRKTTTKPPSPPVPRLLAKNLMFGHLYGTSPKGIRAVYADKPSSEGDAEKAFRLARYCAYSTDAEQLEDAILMLKRYFPLECMALELG